MDHAQRPQRLDQPGLLRVEDVEHLVGLDQVRELAAAFVPVAREQHPQILHRRPRHGVVEVDEVGRIVAPQEVAEVTVAVDADVGPRGLDHRGDPFDQL